MAYKPESKRKRFNVLRSQLETERASFIQHWKDIADYMLPRRPRFERTDVNRGDRRNQKIIDSTATLALRTLASGMMGGVTSPARPWFRLTTPDPDLAETQSVKDWLYSVTQRMLTVLLKSNIYNILPITYKDLGAFGTAAMSVEEDFNDVIRSYSFPIGSYMIATNNRLTVDVFVREFRMTVRQVIEAFSEKNPKSGTISNWDDFSQYVQNQYKDGNLESWIDITHIIQPNEEYKINSPLSGHKKYFSCYYESGKDPSGNNYIGAADEARYLRESGYDLFPILCPRWEVTGEDVYGTDCPGMTILGDVKALQVMHKRKAQAIEKMVNPPMNAPSSMKTSKASILPGDINYLDVREGQQGFRPVHEVRPEIQGLLLDIQDHQQRIKKGLYEDLFLMLASTDRRDITAREVEERHEEKLLALGPVLEQLNQDILDPLVDNVFQIMLRQNLLPQAPEELHGQDLKVEYLSIMAQAQKLVGIAGIERFAGFAGQVAAVHPEALDKIDADQMLDEYGERTSVPPGIIRTDERVAEIRAQRAQAQQAQQMAQNVAQTTGAAKNLSQANLEGDNALNRLLGGNQAAA